MKRALANSGKGVWACRGTLAAVAMLVFAGACQAYTEKTLYSFCSVGHSCRDGSYPSGLVIDSSGNLFGVTYSGGKHGAGVVFEFEPSTGQYSTLHSFCSEKGCKDGSQPERVSLVIDINGSLYGTTSSGGNKHQAGVVFELVRTDSGWKDVTLYRFCSLTNCADGTEPFDGLSYAGAAAGQLYDGVSPLFGTTLYGGVAETSVGTVFSLTPQSGSKTWGEQALYSFCSQANCSDGAAPDTPLFIDSQGDIYGTTPADDYGSNGTVFELIKSGTNYTESVLHSFCAQQNCIDGTDPKGGVTMDAQGNLYGTAVSGGANTYGLIFELSPDGSQWQFADIADFDGTNGASPLAPLTMDNNGDLFGTTYRGGTNNWGTVFEFNGSVRSLYSFCKKCDGTSVGVVEDSAGNLYGVTSQGGDKDKGTLYKLSP
ncbi:MAG TPA: choice-of-anchor tandem repeat GloVer-containing protein [Rhizomicrobium sp.]|nr:choice-of-anchor tandem repeat GloVer-containing protein [Rhizomicrobium sp.]